MWVSNQRRLHKKGVLSQAHTTQLEGIGFIWEVQQHQKYRSTGSTYREDLTALNNVRGLLDASTRNLGHVASIALSEVNSCYTSEPLEDHNVTMSLISIYDINKSEQKVINSLKLTDNRIVFDLKQMCKQYRDKCVVHFVGIGYIRNKDGGIAGMFNHLFALVDEAPEGTTVISHLRTSPSLLYGRTKGLATLVIQVHQCF